MSPIRRAARSLTVMLVFIAVRFRPILLAERNRPHL